MKILLVSFRLQIGPFLVHAMYYFVQDSNSNLEITDIDAIEQRQKLIKKIGNISKLFDRKI